MKENRREFLKKATMLAGGVGVWNMLPASLKKAIAINPEIGSTFYDAEHVVFLMQENRSFDHCFGALQGVRGFNDPRAINLPNKNKVWLQTNAKGETYLPFRLNMLGTKATWMGGLPHSWEDQVDARNNGKYDHWLQAKSPNAPMTLGYYNREDIPFYYAFADAFTVCDQHFSSSLTGTTSNRMFFWTGTIKDRPGSPAWIRNSDIGYSKEVSWKTFPERLEENGISWKVYQNELSIPTDLEGEDEALLANFTNNNLEWFEQYNVRFSSGHYNYLLKSEVRLTNRIKELEKLGILGLESEKESKRQEDLHELNKKLLEVKSEIKKWSPENFRKLSDRERSLHLKGLCTNEEDPDYHKTETFEYQHPDGEIKSVTVPKSDIFHRFRKDVKEGNLPTVSWLVAPQYFSDHPSVPWYGAWYVSETLDILTENPEVWKKTIFILNYDENDGYFDHVPPFVAPNPKDKDTGALSPGLDSSDEFVTMKEEMKKPGMKQSNARESAVGLGYRVPLIIASPWSRGGWVNSELCDITSTLMFLENFLKKKTGKVIHEENISSWRRAICGDLTSAFRPYHGEEVKLPKRVDRNSFMQDIHTAKFKEAPNNFKVLTAEEAKQVNNNPLSFPLFPEQERGIRNSNSLPYELYVKEKTDIINDVFKLEFAAAKLVFGERSAGAAFSVYAPENYLQKNKEGEKSYLPMKVWDLAVEAGGSVNYSWPLSDFEKEGYHLQVYGPNGFYREYQGDAQTQLRVNTGYEILPEKNKAFLIISIRNLGNSSKEVSLGNKMKNGSNLQKLKIPAGGNKEIKLDVAESYNWYDVLITEKSNEVFKRRVAGRIETGKDSKTDPVMGQVRS